ncbi:arginase family protein [Ornithinibacillus californiensis]|uniref:arginase family protein n=1 Tax=Ornithinibacillus californiensis TaxID=161536 RepID=UPI00064DD36E|nr:arginase family protein [Ornithinibacillus californiensis]
MEEAITLLNFDGAYSKQSFYKSSSDNWINFDFMRNISLFCERGSLQDITDRLIEHKQDGICYLGSGNYHYVSYILQSQMKLPYTLILFDHHTDILPAPSENLISCGSWVLESLKTLPMLKKVYILGVSEETNQNIPESVQDKVVIYTKNSLQTNLSTITKSMIKNIPTEAVYISMDKDVLDTKDAMTGWDHGTLRLKQMLKMVKELSKSKDFRGVDVCGEYPVNPMNEYQKETQEALDKNNYANGQILNYIKRWTGKDRNTTLLHA